MHICHYSQGQSIRTLGALGKRLHGALQCPLPDMVKFVTVTLEQGCHTAVLEGRSPV